MAYVDLLEAGGPVTEIAIAKALHISRQSLWRLHRRHPHLRGWLSEQLSARNEYLVAPVINRIGAFALRTASPKHAELFLRAVGALDRDREAPQVGAVAGTVQMQLNVLMPRPDLPEGGSYMLGPGGSRTPVEKPDIPTVAVR